MTVSSIPGSSPLTPTPAPLDLSSIDTPKAPSINTDDAAQMQQVVAMLRSNGASRTDGVAQPDAQDNSVPPGMETSLSSASENIATDMFAFMALFTKIAQQARETAREQRINELQSQVASLQSAADEMVDAASKRFAAAVISATMQIVGGVISIASAAASLKTMKGMSKDDFVTGSAAMVKLQNQQMLANGSSQLIEGSGKMVSSGIEYGASLDDADAKRDEAEATAAQARRETAQEVMQTMGDILKDIREKLAAIVQSDIETSRGIARNI
jgi:hypothetical protein